VCDNAEILLNTFGNPNTTSLPPATYRFVGGSNGVIESESQTERQIGAPWSNKVCQPKFTNDGGCPFGFHPRPIKSKHGHDFIVQFLSFIERPRHSERATADAEAKVEDVVVYIAFPFIRGETTTAAILVGPAKE
jgi:hypothetical protein